MSESIVYLSLGSNIGDRYENLYKTIKILEKTSDIHIIQKSSLYKSEPMYYLKQKNFYNMVIKIKTNLSPHDLLNKCINIERDLGRVKRIKKNRERIIDIDIMLYGNKKINDSKLKIPHPRMTERKFVLYPMHDIEPDLFFDHINENINDVIYGMDDTFKIIKLTTLKLWKIHFI